MGIKLLTESTNGSCGDSDCRQPRGAPRPARRRGGSPCTSGAIGGGVVPERVDGDDDLHALKAEGSLLRRSGAAVGVVGCGRPPRWPCRRTRRAPLTCDGGHEGGRRRQRPGGLNGGCSAASTAAATAGGGDGGREGSMAGAKLPRWRTARPRRRQAGSARRASAA